MLEISSLELIIHTSPLSGSPEPCAEKFRETIEYDMIQVFMMGSNHAHMEHTYTRILIIGSFGNSPL
jgi:hypothetical protein